MEVTYGMFGILPFDRIPGKWHQVMVNDVVARFQGEKHLAFIDADLSCRTIAGGNSVASISMTTFMP